MKHQIFVKSTLLAAMFAVAGVASAAGSATANLTVNATVNANCSIGTTPVAFGTAFNVVTGTAVNATGSVTVSCTIGAIPSITLGLGGNAAASVRRMSDGASNFLSYELYKPPTNTPGAACDYTAPAIWSIASPLVATAATSKTARVYNVCGQINANQDVPPATYGDIVLATVNF